MWFSKSPISSVVFCSHFLQTHHTHLMSSPQTLEVQINVNRQRPCRAALRTFHSESGQQQLPTLQDFQQTCGCSIWDFTRKVDFDRVFTRNLPGRIGFLQAKTLGFSQFSPTKVGVSSAKHQLKVTQMRKNASKIHVGGFLRFGPQGLAANYVNPMP